MTADQTAEAIQSRFKDAVLGRSEFRGETTLVVSKDAVPAICAFCKNELGFDYLVDITSVDNFGEDPRFELVYELYSMRDGVHLRLKCKVSEEDCSAPTVTGVWRTANWHEREIYDMMGIRFNGHPDLRRILMWEGYPYFPLRKDFPLEGKPSEMPDVAFTDKAPLEGGPFVTSPGCATTKDREPRARHPEDED